MICPKCKDQKLTTATVRGIEVDRCKTCDGVWFDKEELTAVLELDQTVRGGLQSHKEDAALDQTRGQCPRDSSDLFRMYSAQENSVVLDVCPTCSGIWLDAGELARLGD